MNIAVERNDNIIVVSFDGMLDVTGSEQISNEVVSMIDKKPLIVSMENCNYLSSSGIRSLVVIAKTAKERKVKLIFAGLSDKIKGILEMTGFIKTLRYVPTVEDALKELSKK